MTEKTHHEYMLEFINSEEDSDVLIVGMIKRIKHLEELNQTLVQCLQEMVDVHDEPCRLDHHGYCQSHFLDDVNDGGCRVANAIEAIKKATGKTA